MGEQFNNVFLQLTKPKRVITDHSTPNSHTEGLPTQINPKQEHFCIRLGYEIAEEPTDGKSGKRQRKERTEAKKKKYR
jgi:hypothetical protein